MKRNVSLVAGAALLSAAWVMAQPADVSVADGFRMVEVASVSDAMEQLYGERAYMSHDMRPLSATKFAGPAVTVQLKKEEHIGCYRSSRSSARSGKRSSSLEGSE